MPEKLEILRDLSEAGLIGRHNQHPTWKKAFEFYWAQTGDYNSKMGCGSCYAKVLKWLKA